jgi:flagellar hook-basal body complex protein FliE
MALPLVTVTPSAAARAYGTVQGGALEGVGGGADFGSVLRDAVSGAIDAGHHADAQAAQAIAGGGNVTDLVTAVSKAELALQTTAAIRDRVVQAYQDIMRMPI